MDLSSTCMELEGDQEGLDLSLEISNFLHSHHPPPPNFFFLYRFVHAVIKKRPDDHYSFVRCMVHTPWHSVVEADFKHVILLSREGKLPFLGIILLIENMTLGICHLLEIPVYKERLIGELTNTNQHEGKHCALKIMHFVMLISMNYKAPNHNQGTLKLMLIKQSKYLFHIELFKKKKFTSCINSGV